MPDADKPTSATAGVSPGRRLAPFFKPSVLAALAAVLLALGGPGHAWAQG